MKHYDPNIDPNPEEWLSIDEQLRIQLVEQFHERAKIQSPNPKAHAAVHAMVENQLAEQLPPVVRAIERLKMQGLTRRDAIHAIGPVITEQFYAMTKNPELANDGNAQSRYDAAVGRLTAQQWLKD